MQKAKDGEIYLFTSPSGWTGNTDHDGKTLTLPESQTYIFQKHGNKINAITIRSSMTLEQHTELLKELNVHIKCDRVTESIRAISSSVANFTEITGSHSLTNVVELISEVMSSNNIWEDSHGQKVWSLHELKTRLAKVDRLETADTRTEQRILNLREFLELELEELTEDSLLGIAQELGRTAIEIKYYMGLPPMNHTVLYSSQVNNLDIRHPQVEQIDYQRQANEIKNLPGCKGVGGRNIQSNALGPNEFSTTGEDEYGSLEFDCPHCGRSNTRPYGQLISECQKCGGDVTC